MSSRIPDNIRQAVNQLGELQQTANDMIELSRNNKQASNNLYVQARAALGRIQQLGTLRQRMQGEIQEELTALLQTATSKQVAHLQNIREILDSEVKHGDIEEIARQLQQALEGQPPEEPRGEAGEGVEMTEMRRGGRSSRRKSVKHMYKGGYPRTPTKGEVVVGHSSRRRTKRTTKTQTKSKSRR
jgi:hypothetical protein